MIKPDYEKLEAYMKKCEQDTSHDSEHIYRVLYIAMEIAAAEEQAGESVDYDVLIAACLLHDIGRAEELTDPSVCHASIGAEKAYRFLVGEGFPEHFAEHVRDCILSHRFRIHHQPKSIEAKILFDADKVDVAGALGIARTLMYRNGRGKSLYSLLPDGSVSEGISDTEPSFFEEYHRKLEKIYSCFYTRRGEELAYSRKSAAVAFYRAMLAEAGASRGNGRKILEEKLAK